MTVNMKISYINYFYDKDVNEANYFQKYHTIHGWCHSLRNEGFEVAVFQRFHRDLQFRKDGITYNLISDNLEPGLRPYQIPFRFHKKIYKEEMHVIHINSFRYALQAYILKRKLTGKKIVIQHHAEHPWKGLKSNLFNLFANSIDGYIFSSKGIYDNWLKNNFLNKRKAFAEIIEGSTTFKIADRNESRKKTRLYGNPVFLWVGRLDENKDPLTIIKGFDLLLKDFPEARLYMIYSEEMLKKDIEHYLQKKHALKESIKLIGFILHSELNDYYNSADYFVLGSHYEGSGFSLLEAMACGVVPLVTDIPSFRTITGNADVGGLWKCGDAESFYKATKIVINRSLTHESQKATKHFNKELSYSALGRKAKAFYESLTSQY